MQNISMCRSIIIIILLSLVVSCIEKSESNQETISQNAESKIPPLENKSFGQLWAIIDSLDSFREDQAVYSVSQYILQKASKEKEVEFAIKAVAKILSIQNSISEKNESLLIDHLETIADSSAGVIQSILYSMAADLNFRYYLNNENKINNNTVEFSSDKAEWNKLKYLNHIQNLFQKSLNNVDRLKLSEISQFKNLLIFDKHTDLSRPSLYNFLAHRAINFYTDILLKEKESNSLAKIKMIPIKSFMIYARQESSLLDELLKLYQDVLKFNQVNQHIYAYVQTNLERMKFYNALIYSANDNRHYLSSLVRFLKEFDDHPASALIARDLSEYYKKAGLFNQAKDVLERNLKRFPNSVSSDELKRLKVQVTKPTLELEITNLIPNVVNTIQIKHRLVSEITIRIIPITLNSFLEKEMDDLTGNDELIPISKQIKISPNTKNKLINLNVNLEPMRPGLYAITTVYKGQDDELYELNQNFQSISNQVFVMRRLSERNVEFYFYELISGKPLSSQQVELRKKNYSTGKFEISDSFLTDKQGFAEISIEPDNEFAVVSKLKSDQLVKAIQIEKSRVSRFNNQLIFNKSRYFETDTIKFYAYFQSEKRKAFKEQTIYFQDSNGNQLDSTKLIADQFGLAQGEISLNGQFAANTYNIHADGSDYPIYVQTTAISAKRFINIKLGLSNYKVGDRIKVVGNLENFNPYTDINKKVTLTLQNLKLNDVLFKTEVPLNQRGEYQYSYQSDKSDKSYRLIAKFIDSNSEELVDYVEFKLSDKKYNYELVHTNSIKIGDPFDLTIISKNIFNQIENVQGNLKIYRLSKFANLLKIYSDVPKSAVLVYSRRAITNQKINLSTKKWRSGSYLVSFKGGKEKEVIGMLNVINIKLPKLNSLNNSIIYHNSETDNDIVELWVGTYLKDVDAWLEFRNRFAQKRSYVRLSEDIRKLEFKRKLLTGFKSVTLFFAKNGQFFSVDCDISAKNNFVSIEDRDYKPSERIQTKLEQNNNEQIIYNFITDSKVEKKEYLQWELDNKLETVQAVATTNTEQKFTQFDQLNWFDFELVRVPHQQQYRLFEPLFNFKESNFTNESYLYKINQIQNAEIELPSKTGKWTMQIMGLNKSGYIGFQEYQFTTKKEIDIEVQDQISAFSGSELLIPIKITNFTNTARKGTAIFKVLDYNEQIIHHDVKTVSINKNQQKNIEWFYKIPQKSDHLKFNIELLTDKEREVSSGKISIQNALPQIITNRIQNFKNNDILRVKDSNTDSIHIDLFPNLKQMAIKYLSKMNQSLLKTDAILSDIMKTIITIKNSKIRQSKLDELFFELIKMQQINGGFSQFPGLESSINTSLNVLRVFYEAKRLRLHEINQPHITYVVNQTLKYMWNELSKAELNIEENELLHELLLMQSAHPQLKQASELIDNVKSSQERFLNSKQRLFKGKIIQIILLNKNFKRASAAKKIEALLSDLPKKMKNMRDLSLFVEALNDLSKQDKSNRYIGDQLISLLTVDSSFNKVEMFSISNNLPNKTSSISGKLEIDGKKVSLNKSHFEKTITIGQQIKFTNLDNPLIAIVNYSNEVKISDPVIEHHFFRQRLTSTSGIQLEKITDNGLSLNDVIIAEILIRPDSTVQNLIIEDFYPAGFEVLSNAPELIQEDGTRYFQYHLSERMVFYIDQFIEKEIKIRYPLRANSKGKLKKGFRKILINNRKIYHNFDNNFISIN